MLLEAGQPVPGRESYLLERPLGPGPQPNVWLARHAKLGHAHVFKFATDGPQLAALKREYTLFRLLSAELGPRDDFTRILDSNFVAPPYFIECPYGGSNLLQWAEEGRQLDALSRADRIALFGQIARAVSAAHAVGVLHKDLKPSNVLVAEAPSAATAGAPDVVAALRWRIRLTDFGSGKLLDPRRLEALQLTTMGVAQAVANDAQPSGGTALYLAPELLAGHAPTVQSDVYALGLMLWQLLVGDLKRPLSTGWEREIDDDLLRMDIAAATEGRVERRLQSAAELLTRLDTLDTRRQQQRTAAEQQLAADRAALELRAARARRPWLWGAIVSLSLGLAASVAFAFQARQALHQAERQTARADAISGFMGEDLLAGIDPAGVGPGGTVSMTALLERASRLAGERFAAQPETEAVVRGQLAGLFHVMSMFESGEREYRRAIALADPAALRTDPRLLRARLDLVSHLAVHDKLKEAKALLPDAERDLAALAALTAPDAALAQSAARATFMVLHSGERFEEALAAGERLLTVVRQRQHAGKAPDEFAVQVMLGDTLYRLGRLERAEAVLVEGARSARETPEIGEISLARARVALARVRVAMGQGAAAEPELLAARDMLLARVGPTEHYVTVANAELASLYDQRGEFARSREAFAAVRANLLRTRGEEHPSTKVMSLNLAISELNLGQAAAALAQLDTGRAWFVKYAGGESGSVVQAIDFERARALTSTGRARDALPVLAALQPERLAEAAPARDWQWRLQAERGRALLATGERNEGLRLIDSALPKMAENGSALWVLAGYRQLRLGGAPR